MGLPNSLTANFTNNKIVAFAILVSFLFLLASLLLALFNFSQLPVEVPLFYSTKDEILARKFWIFLMPLTIFLVNMINFLVSRLWLSNQSFLVHVLLVSQALVSFLIFWAELEIILLF